MRVRNEHCSSHWLLFLRLINAPAKADRNEVFQKSNPSHKRRAYRCEAKSQHIFLAALFFLLCLLLLYMRVELPDI